MIARLIAGAVLGLVVAFPALAALLVAALGVTLTAVASCPPLLAAAAGAWAWPAIGRTVRGWRS